jgi:hypothetical protein
VVLFCTLSGMRRNPQMWRVRDRGGRLSDMVNLSRAKDAAGIVALGILNRPRAIALPTAEHGNYQDQNEPDASDEEWRARPVRGGALV